MRFILALIPVLAMCACTGSPIRASKMEYLTGHAPAGVKAETMRDDLERDQRELGARYMVQAIFLSQPLLEAQDIEKGKRTMASQAEIQKDIDGDVSAMATGKACFVFTLRTMSIETDYFKLYVAKIEDSAGALHPITFRFTDGVQSVPSIGRDPIKYPAMDWMNTTIGCTADAVDATKEMKLHFLPMMESSQMPPATLVWTVNQPGMQAAR